MHFMLGAAGSVLTGMGGAALSWVALNFFGKPILTLREKRREVLEIAEKYAYVDHSSSDELHRRAFEALRDAGNSLRAHSRERALATRIYCRVFGYELDDAARAMLGLAEAARGQYQYDKGVRRLTLHALFVAFGSTHHLSASEIAAARTEMKKWHDGNRDMTTSSGAADNA
jgi:hypothetical protein